MKFEPFLPGFDPEPFGSKRSRRGADCSPTSARRAQRSADRSQLSAGSARLGASRSRSRARRARFSAKRSQPGARYAHFGADRSRTSADRSRSCARCSRAGAQSSFQRAMSSAPRAEAGLTGPTFAANPARRTPERGVRRDIVVESKTERMKLRHQERNRNMPLRLVAPQRNEGGSWEISAAGGYKDGAPTALQINIPLGSLTRRFSKPFLPTCCEFKNGNLWVSVILF